MNSSVAPTTTNSRSTNNRMSQINRRCPIWAVIITVVFIMGTQMSVAHDTYTISSHRQASKSYPFSSSSSSSSSPSALLNQQHQQHQQQQQQLQLQQQLAQQAPIIEHFSFNSNVQENQRQSLTCTVSSGDLPIRLTWFKDGQPLTKELAQANGIKTNLVADYSSTILFQSMKLEHSGNYTCQAQNRAGIVAHSTLLVVHGEPRWLTEPQRESVTLRGQTVIVDCQTIGYPKPTQTWLYSKSAHAEYEPITANDRIQIATNGSLIIKYADKSDEANYLCKSVNGIGQGLSATTKLRVNVPAHFKSKSSTTVVRKHSNVQLRCDVVGDQPITIDWFKNKQKLQLDSEQRYTINQTPSPSGMISVLYIRQAQRQDNSIYECHTKNLVGHDELLIDLAVQEEPDSLQEIQATQIGSRSITIAWTIPYDGKSPIQSYMFQYKEIGADSAPLNDPIAIDALYLPGTQHSSAGSPVEQEWQNAQSVVVGANQSNSCTIEKLDPSTKYVMRALATNAIGQSKFSQPMEFTTDEEAPKSGPAYIQAMGLNSTSIQVEWQEVPKGKQLGRIHGYYVGIRVANSTQGFVFKPYIINELLLSQQHHDSLVAAMASGTMVNQQQQQQQQAYSGGQRLDMVINDLKRDTVYEITVVAFNSRGTGPGSDYVLCKTNEMDPPKPVKIQIKKYSNDSIFVEWQRDPIDQNPVDAYVLYQEKNSASQEWLQIRLPGNQTQYKAPGLKCGTRYQFYIVAHNKVGKSAQSDVVSASTSGALPAVPSKMALIRMVNSTCLSINLNSFQDGGCRIKNVGLRYRVEKSSSTPNSASGAINQQQAKSSGGSASSSASASASSLSSSSSSVSSSSAAATSVSVSSGQASEWITTKQRSKPFQNQEDRIEYLCNLSPTGEYTIHASAGNDVGRSEIEYLVVMSSDEWRQASIIEVLAENIDRMANVPLSYVISRVSPVLTVIVAILLVSFILLLVFVLSLRCYRYLSETIKIKIAQRRAMKRVKRDAAARNRNNNTNHHHHHHGETDMDDGNLDGDDHDDDDDDEFGIPVGLEGGHYFSNLANSGFETSSTDSRESKYGTLRGFQRKRKQQQQMRRQQLRKVNSAGASLSNRYNMKTNLSLSDAAFTIGSSPDLIKIQNDSNSRLKKQQQHNGGTKRSCDQRQCKQGKSCNHKISSSASSDSTDICSSGFFMSSSTESIPKFQYLSNKRDNCVKMNEYTMLPYDYRPQQSGQQPHPQDIYQPVASTMEPSYYSTLRRTSMQSYVPDNHHRHRDTTGDIYGYHYMSAGEQHNAANEANSILVPPSTSQQQYSSPPSISSVTATAAALGYHHLPAPIPTVNTMPPSMGPHHPEQSAYSPYTSPPGMPGTAMNTSGQSHYLAMDHLRASQPMVLQTNPCSRSPSMATNHSNYSSPRIRYADKPNQAYL